MFVFCKLVEEKFHGIFRERFHLFRQALAPTRAFEHAFGQNDFRLVKVTSYSENVFDEQEVNFLREMFFKKFLEVNFVQYAFCKRHPNLEGMRRFGKSANLLKKIADVFGKVGRD